MAEVCKDINVTGGSINTNCCGCQPNDISNTVVAISTPVINIDYRTEEILYDYSATQYIIPIRIVCGCIQNLDDLSSQQPAYKRQNQSIPHSIRVIGSNPSNVSFIIASDKTTVSLTRQRTGTTNSYGYVYSNNPVKTIGGLFMVVDKDPNEVEIPKASTIQVGIKLCPTDSEVIQTIKTEWFFNNNNPGFRPDTNTGQGSVHPNLNCDCEYGGDREGEIITSNNSSLYINAICKEDMGSYWRFPVGYYDHCSDKPFYKYSKHCLGRTIQDLRVTGRYYPYSGSNASYITTTTSASVHYDVTLGIWFVHLPKNEPEQYVTLEADVLMLGHNMPCSQCGSYQPTFNLNQYGFTTITIKNNGAVGSGGDPTLSPSFPDHHLKYLISPGISTC